MFDLNLLGKPGIQPETVKASVSYISESKTAHQISAEAEPEREEPKTKRSLAKFFRVLAVICILLIPVIFYVFVHYNETEGQLIEKDPISKEQALKNAAFIIDQLNEQVKLKQLNIGNGVMTLHLGSNDQMKITILGVELEDKFGTPCRISGDKKSGLNLKMSIPVDQSISKIIDSTAIQQIFSSAGIYNWQLLSQKLSASVNLDEAEILINEFLVSSTIHFKQINIKTYSSDQFTLEVLFESDNPK